MLSRACIIHYEIGHGSTSSTFSNHFSKFTSCSQRCYSGVVLISPSLDRTWCIFTKDIRVRIKQVVVLPSSTHRSFLVYRSCLPPLFPLSVLTCRAYPASRPRRTRQIYVALMFRGLLHADFWCSFGTKPRYIQHDRCKLTNFILRVSSWRKGTHAQLRDIYGCVTLVTDP